jgi:hypothetical protein
MKALISEPDGLCHIRRAIIRAIIDDDHLKIRPS